jgi:hypothetical protein
MDSEPLGIAQKPTGFCEARVKPRNDRANDYSRMFCWFAGGDVFGALDRMDRTGSASRAASDTARPSAKRAVAFELVATVATLLASVPTEQ